MKPEYQKKYFCEIYFSDRPSHFTILNTIIYLSFQVKESDVIDRISLEKSTESTYTLGRVNLVEVGETTKKGNFKVVLDRTKLLEITKTEYVKSWEN